MTHEEAVGRLHDVPLSTLSAATGDECRVSSRRRSPCFLTLP